MFFFGFGQAALTSPSQPDALVEAIMKKFQNISGVSRTCLAMNVKYRLSIFLHPHCGPHVSAKAPQKVKVAEKFFWAKLQCQRTVPICTC